MAEKEILCAYGVDFDAVAGWLGSYGGENSPLDLSRGGASRHFVLRADTGDTTGAVRGTEAGLKDRGRHSCASASVIGQGRWIPAAAGMTAWAPVMAFPRKRECMAVYGRSGTSGK